METAFKSSAIRCRVGGVEADGAGAAAAAADTMGGGAEGGVWGPPQPSAATAMTAQARRVRVRGEVWGFVRIMPS